MKRVFRLPGTRKRIDDDLDAELGFHLDGRIEELMEREGLSRADAEREARRRFGNYDAYRRETHAIDDRTLRGRNRMELFDAVSREMKHAVRALLRTPSFSVIAFIALSLGLGAAVAIYTVLDAVALRPLDYREPDRLVSILHPATVPGNGESTWGLSAGGYFLFRERNHSFENMGVYYTGSTIIADGSEPAPARTAYVTASLFPTLRGRAELGRLIDSTDDVPNAAPVVVLSHEYWTRHFGSDRNAVGKTMQVGSTSRLIVGVTEAGFSLPKPGAFGSTSDLASFGVDLWIPEQLNPNGPFYNSHPYSGVARLRPGATVESAQQELVSLMREFPQKLPNAYTDAFLRRFNFRIAVKSLRDEMLGPSLSRTLWVLFGAVGVVLLIACANVANLFLARVEARRRESAIRTALGADWRQMAVHYFSESLSLSLASGVAGLLVARAGLRALIALAPTSVPRLASVHLGLSSIVFTIALSLIVGIVFGLIPLARAGVDVMTLREGGRGMTASRGQHLARSGLVVVQMSLALVLLAASGLMLRSFANLRHVKPGLDPVGVLTFETVLPGAEYDSLSKVEAFQREFYDRLAALPNVRRVGATSGGLPLQDFGVGCTSVVVEGMTYVGDDRPPCVPTPIAGPGFFESMGIQVRGQAIDWSDFAGIRGHPTVAVVTQALANRLWPGQDPLGKGIAIGNARAGYYRVIGVIPELRGQGLDQPPAEIVYAAAMRSAMTFTVKTSIADPNEVLPSIRRVLAEMNPRIPILDVRTMSDVVDRSVSRANFLMTLLLVSGTMALLLSAVGIYGVISYLVAQRRSEIGVRMALGARMPQVASLILGQSMRLAVVGVAVGLVAAVAGTRLLRSLLFGVSPTDPIVLAATCVVLLAIAAAASLAPTRRAAKIDPVEAMRSA